MALKRLALKMLIMDDQPSVAEGLKAGIRWETLGIDEVYTAYHAARAREILQSDKIDILLCDIEMPMESGLELYRWIMKTGIHLCCIFLTGHAEFSYAQEAIKLGAFDYVLQPADYGDVKQVVGRGVEKIERERGMRQILTMGEVFHENKKSIVGNAFRDFLLGRMDEKSVSHFSGMGHFPSPMSGGWLVLLQIVRWKSMRVQITLKEQAARLEQMFGELFWMNGYKVMVEDMDDNCFACILWDGEDEGMSGQFWHSQLLCLCNLCEREYGFEVACYCQKFERATRVPEYWKEILKWRNGNVALKGGVFETPVPVEDHGEEKAFRFGLWERMLRDGYFEAVGRQMDEVLDHLVNDDVMTEALLHRFYQDFVRLLYQAYEESEGGVFWIFESADGLDLYRNGMRSVEALKKFIHYGIQQLKESMHAGKDDADVVEKIKDYVDGHLEEEIHREDIARKVFLSPDYMVRLFKRETGTTLKEFVTMQKMKMAQKLLQTTKLSVSVIAARLGYKNFSHFSTSYKKVIGNSPHEERRERT